MAYVDNQFRRKISLRYFGCVKNKHFGVVGEKVCCDGAKM